MDTVTRAPMAIVQAEEGGLGIIDRGFRAGDIAPQVREVEKVKRTQHVIIRDPYAVAPRPPSADAVALMRRSRMGTLVVVDDQRRLKGLLTERDVRFMPTDRGTVATRMTPVDRACDRRRRTVARSGRAADGRTQDQKAATCRSPTACSSG